MCDDTRTKEYLRKVAESQKEALSVLTDRTSTTHRRGQILEAVATTRAFLQGFFWGLAVVYGEDRAQYYLEYFYQAQSDKGFDIEL
jgi:hypothetical protein